MPICSSIAARDVAAIKRAISRITAGLESFCAAYATTTF